MARVVRFRAGANPLPRSGSLRSATSKRRSTPSLPRNLPQNLGDKLYQLARQSPHHVHAIARLVEVLLLKTSPPESKAEMK